MDPGRTPPALHISHISYLVSKKIGAVAFATAPFQVLDQLGLMDMVVE